MTDSYSTETPEPDDRRLMSLLKQIDHDLPEPDFAAMAAIEALATAAFDAATFDTTFVDVAATDPAKTGTSEVRLTILNPTEEQGTKFNSRSQHERRHPMFTILASRVVASIAAFASTVALWFAISSPGSTVNATPFSKVLSELQRAESIQLQITREGNIADVWIRSPGLVRYEESPQKYQIAAGSRLWKIDETANTVEETDSPWFLSSQERVDLLSLLHSDITDASRLLRSRPTGRTVRDGRDCMVYRVTLPGKSGSVDVEATVDRENLRLLDLAAWKADDQRTGAPLAEMVLVALNVAIADEQFTVSKSLSEDGRIGAVTDAQGIVVLRPKLARRWTPVSRETLIAPGDWIRTEVRGANAVKVRLTSDAAVTLGPGTLVEFISQREIRLHYGMIQSETGDAPFVVLGARDSRRDMGTKESLILRMDREDALTEVSQKPAWLLGFEGASNNESLGSLIVTLPDGRNEPLTVGDHKVTVEIRDQIARTTIEESFVNHTANRLEGVFHFPLPQDASISGFGMWIGNELVEADVVEKQRAREIYETILRERRDPGLLEWTNGNIFKARVFPIEARSEKRVKIVYTQVLPLRANKYRYSYGLRSELLRTKPLRELSLRVTANSALPLKRVTCPTHTTRDQITPHSAEVEFTAQEYTPDRDFEVVFEVDGRQNDVVVIPHQRGDDGYFLVQLTPPSPDGNFRREVIPDGTPLKLILICDTSMSMDESKRREQADFVAALLASLSPDDQFQVVAADVAPAKASGGLQPATEEAIAAAKTFLASRISLGWTNLDTAFQDIISTAPSDANIVYVGDGLLSASTSGAASDTDAPAFVNRLRTLLENRRGADAASTSSQIALHAVTVGNTNDSVIMRGIATVGGGSSRVITGEQTPQTVATELLNEIALPGLKNLQIEFKGLKVAAVYPEQIPNVAAGTQQILVGRYLPEGKDQQGEVIVTGLRGTEIVRYAARVSLKDAEEGNSFIPRLWARSHLDHLLAQGGGSVIRDDIIRLSEEFHIITPYTSLLVLESDADRERFGVKRRYEMRDGERFFAEGRANTNFELLQQQMKLAGTWRQGLRRRILAELAQLGRNESLFRQELEVFARQVSQRGAIGRFRGADVSRLGEDFKQMNEGDFLMTGGGGGGFGGGSGEGSYLGDTNGLVMESDYASPDLTEPGPGYANAGDAHPMAKRSEVSQSLDRIGAFDGPAEFIVGLRDAKESFVGYDFDEELRNQPVGGLSGYHMGGAPGGMGYDKAKNVSYWTSSGWGPGRGYYSEVDYTAWLSSLFPSLTAVVPPATVKPAAEAESPSSWSPEAIALAKSLLRTERLRSLEGGVEIYHDSENTDPVWKRIVSRNAVIAMYSPAAWATRNIGLSDQTIVNFCDAKERGVYSVAFGLGRVRTSQVNELETPPLPLSDYSLSSLEETFRAWTASVESVDEKTSRIVLVLHGTEQRQIFTIDTDRHVLVKLEQLDGHQPGVVTTFEDFVEVGGTWWSRHIQMFDAQGRRIFDTVLSIQHHDPVTFQERMVQLLKEKSAVQFLHSPAPGLAKARQRVADASAAFEDHIIMILHHARLQQWEEMWKHVDAMEALAADKSGVRWIRTVLQVLTRRHEEARVRILAETQKLAQATNPDDVFLAEFVLGQFNSIASSQEFYDVHQQLRPVYFRTLEERIVSPPNPAPLAVHWRDDAAMEQKSRAAMISRIQDQWIGREAAALDRIGKVKEAFAVYRTIAESRPWDVYQQQLFSERLQQIEGVAAAEAWLRRESARPERTEYEHSVLRPLVFNLLKSQGKWQELSQWTEEWVKNQPDDPQYHTAYGYRLAALVFSGDLETADALAEQWLLDARVEGKLFAQQRQKLDAALNYLHGQLPGMNFQWQTERPIQLLADTARFFANHPHHFDVVQRCFYSGNFSGSEYMDQVRGEWLNNLRGHAATIPSGRLPTLISWTMSGRLSLAEPIDDRMELDASEVPDRIWSEIAAALKIRWENAATKAEKQEVSDAIFVIYSNRFRNTELIPFLRERIARASVDPLFAPADRLVYRAAMFEELLRMPWTEEFELQAFTLLRQLVDESDPNRNTSIAKLEVELPALMRMVDAMLANRIAVDERRLHDDGETDKLTRQELAAKKRAIRENANRQLSARLAELASKEEGPLRDWLILEYIWIQVSQGQIPADADSTCWRILGDTPEKQTEDSTEEFDDLAAIADGVGSPLRRSVNPDDELRKFYELRLKSRAFVTVMYLATRPSADPDGAQRLLRFIDQGIGFGDLATSYWRLTKFRLLMALDRPDELETALREWVRADVLTAPWRKLLAQLLAERGELQEAITLFEACEKDHLLTANDYSSLSRWYLVLNRRSDYERVQLEIFRQMPEQQLAQILYAAYTAQQQVSSASQTPTSEVSNQVLMAIRVLLEKSGSPESYFYYVNSVYTSSRDFRILKVIPDAVLGRTAQQAYSILQSIQNTIMGEIRNEATADELMSRIAELRQRPLTTVDLRALDLLEAMIERKSAEVLNQPGPHLAASVAAMQRAFRHQWSEGEPRLMASYLRQLGTLPHEAMKAEQLRQLRALCEMPEIASRDRLFMKLDLSELLFYSYSERRQGLGLLEPEIQEWSRRNQEIWPQEDMDVLYRYVNLLESAQEFSKAEAVLMKYMSRPAHRQQEIALRERLRSLYQRALDADGAVSIGSGRAALFAALFELFRKDLAAAGDESQRYTLVVQMVDTLQTARRHQLAGCVERTEELVFRIIPDVLKNQQENYRETVSHPITLIRDVLGPKGRLRYAVERLEQYPARFLVHYERPWDTLGGELSVARQEGGTSEYDERILKLILPQLKHSLTNSSFGSIPIAYMGYAEFWAEKSEEFAKVAEEVLRERRDSGRRAFQVAYYLRNGLGRNPRAIEILLIARAQGRLDESMLQSLVQWLREDQRLPEAIDVLEKLVELRPGNIQYRTDLMTSYFAAQRAEQLQTLIQHTNEHFHAGGRWTEAVAAQFAAGCQAVGESDLARKYMNEAIVLHQRANPASGVNDQVLSGYYEQLAYMESTLGNSREAVTAAISAITCWSSQQEERQLSIVALKFTLRSVKELENLIKQLDAEAAQSGQDNPVLRKAIGQILVERSQHEDAVRQFQLALELQPNDRETHEALIAALDAKGDSMAAASQLRTLIHLMPHELSLYVQLADRLKENPAEAERAATSIVESSPMEAEPHQLYAERLQSQSRWAEAIPHWQQVVRYRRLEPTGLLKLAEAQLHEKQYDNARATIKTLRSTTWPARFTDLDTQLRNLESQLAP